jgi:hypothetical protein
MRRRGNKSYKRQRRQRGGEGEGGDQETKNTTAAAAAAPPLAATNPPPTQTPPPPTNSFLNRVSSFFVPKQSVGQPVVNQIAAPADDDDDDDEVKEKVMPNETEDHNEAHVLHGKRKQRKTCKVKAYAKLQRQYNNCMKRLQKLKAKLNKTHKVK